MKYVFGIAIVVALLMAGWRIAEPEVTNLVFQDDLQDAAAQIGWRTGMTGPRSEEDLRDLVILKAGPQEIEPVPKEGKVGREGEPDYPVWYIATQYTVKIDLMVYSYKKQFHPTSKGGKW